MRTSSILLALALTAWVAGAAPPNDDCATATVVSSFPFHATLDTTTATTDLTDPLASCIGGGVNSVWYAYTASRAVSLQITTSGTTFRPLVSVHTGACGAFSEIACATLEDAGNGNAPALVHVAAHQTAWILGQSFSVLGGTLELDVVNSRVDATPPSSLRAIATSSQPTPIGGAFSSFSRPIALSKPEVAFAGTSTGVFVHDGTSVNAVAMAGDPSPVGGTFRSFSQPIAGRNGNVAFVGNLDGTTATRAVFVRAGGVLSAVAAEGGPAPGGGPFQSFASGMGFSPSSAIAAFIVDTSLDGREAIFLAQGGTITPLASDGRPPPSAVPTRSLRRSRACRTHRRRGETAVPQLMKCVGTCEHRHVPAAIEEMPPRSYMAQPALSLATAPTQSGDGVEPRHLDSRPCILSRLSHLHLRTSASPSSRSARASSKPT